MHKYFQRVKTLALNHVVTDRLVIDEDLVLYILDGLSVEYGPFCTSISTWAESVLLADLLSYLLTKEFFIPRNSFPTEISVNLAHRKSYLDGSRR